MLTQKQIDEWLADELGKIGITGWGAKIAAKLLPTRYFTQEFTINADLASIINAIPSILVDTKLFNDHETRIIYGLPRSGAMNPVVVTVKVTAETEKSHISLCGRYGSPFFKSVGVRVSPGPRVCFSVPR
jgi:hypothetical protein